MSHILNDKWVLWFHDIDETDWSINGYKKIADINTIEDFWNIYKMLDEVTIQNSMFFLMRNGINPIWEDEKNINGGCWSFKINKKEVYDTWKDLSIHLLGENVSRELKNSLIINGISISPKKNFSIIKIWNNNNKITHNILSKKIPNIYVYDSIYKSHK